jgi:hypothetical protein
MPAFRRHDAGGSLETTAGTAVPHQEATGGTPAPQEPLGAYFCPTFAVQQTPTAMVSCNGHAVIEYAVDLKDCCLLQSRVDERMPAAPSPARADRFLENPCLGYAISIQAVAGRTWLAGTSG